MLAGELARLVIEAEHAQRIHAPEHALDTRSRHVAERQLSFGGDRLAEVALARAWRTFEQQTADRRAAHQLEALDTLEQRDHLAGRLEDFGVALVVLEADARLTWHQPVNARAPDEPEQHDELEDHQEGDVEQLEDQVQARRDERTHDVPLRIDDEEAQEGQYPDHEERSDQGADSSQGVVNFAVERVVLVQAEVQVERTIWWAHSDLPSSPRTLSLLDLCD